jgi:hypothetical protein
LEGRGLLCPPLGSHWTMQEVWGNCASRPESLKSVLVASGMSEVSGVIGGIARTVQGGEQIRRCGQFRKRTLTITESSAGKEGNQAFQYCNWTPRDCNFFKSLQVVGLSLSFAMESLPRSTLPRRRRIKLTEQELHRDKWPRRRGK